MKCKESIKISNNQREFCIILTQKSIGVVEKTICETIFNWFLRRKKSHMLYTQEVVTSGWFVDLHINNSLCSIQITYLHLFQCNSVHRAFDLFLLQTFFSIKTIKPLRNNQIVFCPNLSFE